MRISEVAASYQRSSSNHTGYFLNILIGGGKDGILYSVDADHLGNTLP
jgi:hypothetical protein